VSFALEIHYDCKLSMRSLNVDRWRALIFGVASPYSYRVLCLGNQAVCYTQIGQAKKAMTLYEEALQEEPNYRLAKLGLNGLRAVLREAGGGSNTTA
jgi:tetratricopeptide (TPR) repeat protein